MCLYVCLFCLRTCTCKCHKLLQGEGNTEYFLGLTPMGIVVYKNKSKVGNYFWYVILETVYYYISK